MNLDRVEVFQVEEVEHGASMPDDSKLRRLFRAAVAEVNQRERELKDGGKKKKKKKKDRHHISHDRLTRTGRTSQASMSSLSASLIGELVLCPRFNG